MKGVKRFLFPGVLLFVLFIPQSAFALSATVTEGLVADSPSFAISNGGEHFMPYRMYKNDGASWYLVYSNRSGLWPGESADITVSFNSGGLPPGIYSSSFTLVTYVTTHVGEDHVTSSHSESIPVTLTVLEPNVVVMPQSVEVNVTQGMMPGYGYFEVENTGNTGRGQLAYYFSSDRNWLKFYFPEPPFQGTPPKLGDGGTGKVQVYFNPTVTQHFTPGAHTGTITVKSGATEENVEVVLNVLAPNIVVDPSSISVNSSDMRVVGDYRTFDVDNSGNIGNGWLYYTFSIEYSDPPPPQHWMSLNFHDFPTTYWGYPYLPTGWRKPVRVYFDMRGLSEGVYEGEVHVRSGITEKVVPVRLRVGGCEVQASVSPDEVRPQATGGSPTDTKAAVMVWLEQPAPPGGCTIELDTEFVPFSGGHNHHSSLRQKGEVGPKSFYIPEGEDGPYAATYTSSDVAGEEKIVVKVKETDEEKELDMIVRVPELEPFSGNPFCRLTGQTDTHPDNHYATIGTKISTWSTCQEFVETTAATLGINDMSLKWGGLFDIYANWSSPHGYHRIGTHADIDRCARSLTDPDIIDESCRELGYPEGYIWVDRDLMRMLCKKYGRRLAKESTIHCNY